MEAHGAAWSQILRDEEPDTIIREVDPDDGYRRDGPVAIQLAQALHHGSEHRTQVCTALTTLGIEPPSLLVWDFGIETGKVIDEFPPD
jgi:uncharacterized damage-inducible protein DinB